jgi:transcriptional regulator with XRE-family HTH domain
MSIWWDYVSAGLERKGWSQSDLATEIEVNRSAVSNWATKGAVAKPPVARRVARALGTTEADALKAAGHAPEDTSGDPVGGGVSPVDMTGLAPADLDRVRGFVEGLRAARGKED